MRLVDIEAAEVLADRCMPENCSSHVGRQTGWISPFDLREPAPTGEVGGLDKVTLGVRQLEELLATISGIAEEQMSPRRVNFLRCPRANRVQGHNRAGARNTRQSAKVLVHTHMGGPAVSRWDVDKVNGIARGLGKPL